MPNEKKSKSKCVEYLRHAEYYDMQNTFDELYARSQAGEIFDCLMDVILSFYTGNGQAENFRYWQTYC